MRRTDILAFCLVVLVSPVARAQAAAPAPGGALRDVIERLRADEESLDRKYPRPRSDARRERLQKFYAAELASQDAANYDALGADDRIDWQLLRTYLRRQQRSLAREAAREAETAPLLPFRAEILAFTDARLRFESIVPRDAATRLDALAKSMAPLEKQLDGGGLDATTLICAHRAVRQARELKGALDAWFRYFSGYEPLFDWWCKKPYEAVSEALDRYLGKVQKRLVDDRAGGDASLIGDPIGEEALREELDFEFIPYTPAELVEIANREFAWCDAEMAKASREMGFGDDWRKAQEHVKTLHVEPGRQSDLVRDLAQEAIDYVTSRDLVTVPELCRETWRMEMMSPAAQRVNPFFLGGEVILVSYPTDTMTQDEKLQSLRANNRHFARAVVHHELIPGHHLQGFISDRWRPYRRAFSTPFWVEGWALYWELRLFDMGFAATPEDRLGMLFWRKHRCARIIFSLAFQSGKMTAKEAVDFLVDRVGHERASAEGEVRRSIGGDYGPLYQAAYLLGGMQIRAAQRELVGGGTMKEKAFHDGVLQQNSIPIALVRAALRGDALPRNYAPTWRFADPAPK